MGVPESLYAAVDFQYRGIKIGKLLYLAMHEEFKNRNIKKYIAKVDCSNDASLKILFSLKGKTVKKFLENNVERYLVEVETK